VSLEKGNKYYIFTFNQKKISLKNTVHNFQTNINFEVD